MSNTQQVELTEVLIPETPAEVTEVSAPVAQVEVTESVDPAPERTAIILQPEPEPELTAIVSEPFLADTTDDWTLGEGWQLVPLDGNYALQANGIAQATSYSQSTFSDVAVEALVQSQDMTIELHLRQSDLDSYYLNLSPDGTVSIYKNDLVLASTMVTSNIPNQWRQIRFSAIGYTLRASIDNVEVLVATDIQPLSEGNVSFSTTPSSTNVNQTLLLDNMRIWIPTIDLLTSALTATSTSTSTTIPTNTQVSAPQLVTTPSTIMPNELETSTQAINEVIPELTQEIFVEEQSISNTNFILVYQDIFEDPIFTDWIKGDSWYPRVNRNGMALGIENSTRIGSLYNFDYFDVSMQIDFLLYSGSAKLAIRHNVTDSYMVEIYSTGEIFLLRSGQIVQSTIATGILPNEWYTLNISAIGSIVEVKLNNSTIFTYDDPIVLPSGTIAFPANGSNDLLFDNLLVYVSEQEYQNSPFIMGSQLTQLTPGQGLITQQLQPQNNTNPPIAFTMANDIYYAYFNNPNNSVQLTDDGHFTSALNKIFNRYPSYSRDGSLLAFNKNSDLYIVNGTGGVSQLLVPFAFQPSWSPDGNYIAYSGWDGSTSQIFIVEVANPNNIRQLTTMRSAEHPSWSPAGNTILFSSRLSSGSYDIFGITFDENTVSIPINLTNNSNSNERHPEWSNNGNAIAFISTIDRPNDGGEYYTMSVNVNDGVFATGVFNRITFTTNDRETQTCGGPSWLPDDTRVMFTQQNTPISYANSIDGSELTQWSGFNRYCAEVGGNYSPVITPTPTVVPTATPISCSPGTFAQLNGVALLSNDPTQCSTPVEIVVTTNELGLNGSDSLCSLTEAIHYINGDTTNYGCTASIIIDGQQSRIVLQDSQIYSIQQEYLGSYTGQFGVNGLPVICCDVVIEGNGATITRDLISVSFRIFEVGEGANVTLQNLTISNGSADGNGGAILGNDAHISIRNSRIQNNVASDSGGGIYTNGGSLSIVTSDLRYNSASSGGTGNAVSVKNPTVPSRLRSSCIVGNNGSLSTVYVENINVANFDALRNWWGAANGPNQLGSDTVAGTNIDFTIYRASEPQSLQLSDGSTRLGCTEPYNVRFVTDNTVVWTDGEIANVIKGVRSTGLALEQLLNEQGVNNVAAHSPEEAFNRIIVDSNNNLFDGYVLFVRTTSSNTLTIPHPDGQSAPILIGTLEAPIGDACFSQGGNPSNNIPQAITCNNFDTDPFQSETIVHELGHILDFRHTGYSSTSVITFYLQDRLAFAYNSATMPSGGPLVLTACPSIAQEQDVNGWIIMAGANVIGERAFARGSSGWGSYAFNARGEEIKSRFQRNLESNSAETTADMFLNWVYRSTSTDTTVTFTDSTGAIVSIQISNVETDVSGLNTPDGCISENRQILRTTNSLTDSNTIIQGWDGFLNILSRNETTLSFEWGMPGDIRHIFMTNILIDLLTINNDW